MIDPALSLNWEHQLRRDVDRTIALAIGDLETLGLRQVLERSVTGGKRIRPLLTVLACCAAGGTEEDALPPAAAIELLHASSLVHDDIMDNADLRRGVSTVHKRHGVPMAILAGDALIALAYRVLATTRSRNVQEILMMFSECFVALCEGQCADIQVPEGSLSDPAQHAWMVERKTARLLEACMRIGALVGSSDRLVVDALGMFGLHLGFAYQAVDDLLDAIGDEGATGKSAGQDVQNGRRTYLTLAYPALDMVAATRSIVADHTNRAVTAIGELPHSPARTRLVELALALRDRMS